jgi:hypothetical protein
MKGTSVVETETEDEEEYRTVLTDLIGTFTGFDEIAIRRHFGEKFTALEDVLPVRAAQFVVLRRGGLSDRDAYRAAMEMPFSQVTVLFDTEETAEPEPDDPSFDEEYATFVAALGLPFTPREYCELTISQRAALRTALSRR